MNILTCAALLVFPAGLRHLIRGVGPAFAWLANLVYGSGLAYVTVTLVEAGVVLPITSSMQVKRYADAH